MQANNAMIYPACFQGQSWDKVVQVCRDGHLQYLLSICKLAGMDMYSVCYPSITLMPHSFQERPPKEVAIPREGEASELQTDGQIQDDVDVHPQRLAQPYPMADPQQHVMEFLTVNTVFSFCPYHSNVLQYFIHIHNTVLGSSELRNSVNDHKAVFSEVCTPSPTGRVTSSQCNAFYQHFLINNSCLLYFCIQI